MAKEETGTFSDKGCQNKRRHQALCDPYNFFALVIVHMVLLGRDGKDVIDPRLFLSSDKSSSLLNEEIKMMVLTAMGVKEELKDLQRNPTITKTGSEEQKRGISYSPITDNTGRTLAWTTHIKDHAFNKDGRVHTYRLNEINYLQTIPTGPKPKPASHVDLETTSTTDVDISTTNVPVDVLHISTTPGSFPIEISTPASDTLYELPQSLASDAANHQDIVPENVNLNEKIEDQQSAEAREDAMLLEYQNKFDCQEAWQYINLIVIPTALQTQKNAIIEDFYTSGIATQPLKYSSANMVNMGYIDRSALEDDAEVDKLSQTMKYRLLVAVDGERNHVREIKRLVTKPTVNLDELEIVGEREHDTESQSNPIESDPAVTGRPETDTEPEISAQSTDVIIDSAAYFAELNLRSWKSKIAELNIEFLKLSSSCSKQQQIGDVMPGFRSFHQFWRSNMFKHFDVNVSRLSVHFLLFISINCTAKCLMTNRKPWHLHTCQLSNRYSKMYLLPRTGHLRSFSS